ncbi:MAG: GNAT family N-acetyltransferase [Solirubrobacteraceae bacterium]
MLELRPITAADAPPLLSLLSDPQVAVWLRPHGVTERFTLQECAAFARRDTAHWEAHGFGTSIAWQDDTCVGWSLLRHSIVAGRGEVEIGWTVARARWGAGIGTSLGAYAIDIAGRHGVTEVVAFTRVDNRASRRVMGKLGMSYERDFPHAGYPHALYRSRGS